MREKHCYLESFIIDEFMCEIKKQDPKVVMENR